MMKLDSRLNGRTEQKVEEKGNDWISSLILLENLPPGISEKQLYLWIYHKLSEKPKRIVFVDEEPSHPKSCYLIELLSPSISGYHLCQRYSKSVVKYDIDVHCEKLRSEQFAQRCLNKNKNGPNVSLAKKCLIVREVSKEFLLKDKEIVRKNFEACIDGKVKQVREITNDLMPSNRSDGLTMMLEFDSEECVRHIFRSFNRKQKKLSIPLRMVYLTERATTFARSNLKNAKDIDGTEFDAKIIQSNDSISNDEYKAKDLEQKFMAKIATLSKQILEMKEGISERNVDLEHMKNSMKQFLEEKDRQLLDSKKEAQSILDHLIMEKKKDVQELRDQLKEKDDLLATSRKSEMVLQHKLEAMMKEQIAMKEQRDHHQHKSSEYEVKIDELKNTIVEMRRRRNAGSEKNHEAYLKKLRIEYGSKMKKELSSVQDKLFKSHEKLKKNTSNSIKSSKPTPSLKDMIKSPRSSKRKIQYNSSTLLESSSTEVAANVEFESDVITGTAQMICDADKIGYSEGTLKKDDSLEQDNESKSKEQPSKRNDEAKQRREVEWETVLSMFTEKNISRSENGRHISRPLIFPADSCDSEGIAVNLVVDIPNNYLAEADSLLSIHATLAPHQDKNLSNLENLVVTSIPFLLATCRWEAKNLKGQESLLFVLLSAETWMQNEWQDILVKNNVKTSPKRSSDSQENSEETKNSSEG